MKNANRSQIELQIIYRISQALAHQHDVTNLVDEVLGILETDVGFSRGTLTLRHPDTDDFVVEAPTRLTSAERKARQDPLAHHVAAHVAQTRQPFLARDMTTDPRFPRAKSGTPTAFLCVPIVHQRRVIGTMSIERPATTDAELRNDLKFLKLIADLLAEAVARIREDIEERESLMAENRRLLQELDDRYHPKNILGNCSSMRQVYEHIAQVADTGATVLVRGESGTGKELVARAIHYSSSRRSNPFVSVNCAALPEGLIESELFGHEKGSFTGATDERRGRFEIANGGTLFLDEIGDISPNVQVRLLRTLQERSFERVGGNKTISVNVRIVAATSKNLEEEMQQNRFREDLFYRLNVFPIHLPPLRDRRSDIMLLADHFVQKYSDLYNKRVRRISSAAINMMMDYHWPGNVRELENCIERAVLTATDNVIHGYGLPPSLQTSDNTGTAVLPEDGASLKDMVNSYTRELIIDGLKKNRGNVAATARHLRTTQRILSYQMRQLSVRAADYRPR